MEWKINKLSSRIVKVVPHTVQESVVIHLLIGGIIGWLTFLAFESNQGLIAYIGLGLTIIFLIIVLFDIYMMITNYRSRKRNVGADENQ